MAVVIRMKQMGRTHRHYYRIVAIDKRQPRDGLAIEELGTYDPHVADKARRVTLVPSRIKYWQSVGAIPSDQCRVLFDKFLKTWETREAEDAAKKTAAATPPAPAAS